MQFIGSNNSECWIANLPPPLMTDDRHEQSLRGRDRLLYRFDRARRDEEEDKYW